MESLSVFGFIGFMDSWIFLILIEKKLHGSSPKYQYQIPNP